MISLQVICTRQKKADIAARMTNCEQDNKRKARGNCAQGLFVIKGGDFRGEKEERRGLRWLLDRKEVRK